MVIIGWYPVPAKCASSNFLSPDLYSDISVSSALAKSSYFPGTIEQLLAGGTLSFSLPSSWQAWAGGSWHHDKDDQWCCFLSTSFNLSSLPTLLFNTSLMYELTTYELLSLFLSVPSTVITGRAPKREKEESINMSSYSAWAHSSNATLQKCRHLRLNSNTL